MRRHRNAKIVATRGPASSEPAVLRRLFEAGADVFRFNMSHGDHADCQRRSKSTPLAGVKMHHLMRFSPALAVVPVVHRRDPRCFV